MFKLVAAILFALIAGLATFLAGLSSEVRFFITLSRTIAAFVIAGLLSWLLLFLLEGRGVWDIDRLRKLLKEEKTSLARAKLAADMQAAQAEVGFEDEEAGDDAEAPAEADSPDEGASNAAASEAGAASDEEASNNSFTPLGADNFRRVETGETSGAA